MSNEDSEIIPRPERRNTDIECLRAVAVLGVVLHHMQGNLFYPGLPIFGQLLQHMDFWFGVDLFFAISGFVIARSLLPQMTACGKNRKEQFGVIGAFWIRRFWRLLPSAWLWLGIILLAVVGFNHSGAFGTLHANLMATLAGMFDVGNFRFASAFFRYEYGASFVYWSLSLEEQFYLLLPLLVACLRKRIDLLMIALFLIQLCLIRTPLLMSLRTDALALGVLLAICEKKKFIAALDPHWLLRLGWLRSLLPCALLLALAVICSADLQAWRFRISALAVLSAVLVWLASYNRDYLLGRCRLKDALVWVGARSYAIYLVHVPVYFLLREINFRLAAHQAHLAMHSAVLFIVALAIIFALADLNYRYVEQPLRHYGKNVADRFMRRRLPSTGAEGTALTEKQGHISGSPAR